MGNSQGMRFIHRSVMQYHGRLTSSNCAVDGRFNLKITDFGLPQLQRRVDLAQLNSNQFLEKLLWVAPEHLEVFGKRYRVTGASQKGDVYSFGIILEEVILRSLPFDTCRGLIETKDILNKVMAHESPPFRPKVPTQEAPAGLMLLMLQCWEELPTLRPSFDVIFKKVKSLHSNKDGSLVDTLLRRLEDYASNLEDVVEERTMELLEEKKKSEMLLYQILPRTVADQLRQGKSVVPELYDCVTVYFSDVVGFTAMSADSTPIQVVEFLNDLYSLFDSVIEKYDVYKVETIGDAYMVVSGLPEKKADVQHAVEICRMALQLLDRTRSFQIRHRPGDRLLLRIGVHSGVVGLKMPRYCLFGDTVNTASRMESNGEALKIHLSWSTKECLDKFGTFVTELRGQVNMKGKGAQTTFWLLGEKEATITA